MSEAKDTTTALNVRLKPSESSAHPRATNYTNVGVAQGIAYLDFGFIEPTLLAAIAKTAKDGQAAPKGLEGALVTRVADGGGCARAVASADSASPGRLARCAEAEQESVRTNVGQLTTMRKGMRLKLTLTVLLFLIAISPQLAGCAEVAPYPIKDSGLLTEEADLVWLDNQRVLFHGYKAVEQAKIQKEFPRYIDRGLYLWDTKTGAVELYDTFEERKDGLQLKSPLCVHDGMLTYVNRGMVITGKRGQETKTTFPKPSHWFNPHSCRHYETKPFWAVDGHRTIPLLEEHGYLDLGTVSPPQPNYLTLRLDDPNPAISFYSVAAKKSVPLPIGWLEVRILQVHYAPFSNTYLLSGLQYYDDKRGFLPAWPDDAPLRVWWLSPDGILKKQEVPNPPWMHGSYFSFVPTRTGLFIVKHSTAGTERPGTIGGYLVRGQEVKKVVVGLLHKVAISPDGCTAAVVNDTYEKKPVSERTRLQIIQLCQGE